MSHQWFSLLVLLNDSVASWGWVYVLLICVLILLVLFCLTGYSVWVWFSLVFISPILHRFILCLFLNFSLPFGWFIKDSNSCTTASFLGPMAHLSQFLSTSVWWALSTLTFLSPICLILGDRKRGSYVGGICSIFLFLSSFTTVSLFFFGQIICQIPALRVGCGLYFSTISSCPLNTSCTRVLLINPRSPTRLT